MEGSKSVSIVDGQCRGKREERRRKELGVEAEAEDEESDGRMDGDIGLKKGFRT